MTKQIKIDASGQKLGRLASRIAKTLMGKDRPDYAPNKVVDVEVLVENVDKLDINDKKLDNETHERYSGYPGGRKVFSWREVAEKKGYFELLRVAVKGMLPNNKLKDKRMKRLKELKVENK